VGDLFAVGRLKSAGNLPGVICSNIYRQRSAFQFLSQCFPLDKSHHDEGHSIRFPDIMNRTDVGMIELGNGLSLAQQTFFQFIANTTGRGQKLQCYDAVEAGVAGFIDNAHPPFTEFLEDLIMGYREANHRTSSRYPPGIRSESCIRRPVEKFLLDQ
jgi:hypothetical protein